MNNSKKKTPAKPIGKFKDLDSKKKNPKGGNFSLGAKLPTITSETIKTAWIEIS
jgi:hypothetical protein